MTITYHKLRSDFIEFWTSRNHKEVPSIPLVPQNDPTTLFTGSGMQQLVPNLLGEPHPLGKRLFNIQRSFRSQDIEEVGDNRHTTMFEMMGNWSLGDYFKEEQLSWFYQFLTENLKLDPSRLYVSIFKGGSGVPRDDESYAIWRKLGMPEDHIFEYDDKKNWWARMLPIAAMPAGEVGGPDSEVFFDFGAQLKMHEHSDYKGGDCHPNCDCGRFMEIGNCVFVQYKKEADGTLSELPNKNVDFGGGLERLLAASNNDPDIFKSDAYSRIIPGIEEITQKSYADEKYQKAMRVIADHMKAATFLIKDGVRPSNKEQGYVLRRLLRRSAVKYRNLVDSFRPQDLTEIVKAVLQTYGDIYFDMQKDEQEITAFINDEMVRFGRTLERGLKEAEKIEQIDGTKAFDLYQTFGFPLEVTEELFLEKGQNIDREQFRAEFDKHKNLSRSASAGKFKGGLADHSEQVLKYHTATHLLHQALHDTMGEDVRQEGSNITAERLRFDFYSQKKPTAEEVKTIEQIMNDKIKEALPMRFKIMPKDEANKVGARSFFREKYPDMVKVYYIGGVDEQPKTAYSKEFCGGPHVQNTAEIGSISIYKIETIGSNLYRIYAK
jgi:alanyl-tRNA synthetase